jgi:cytochrome P450
MRYQELPLRKGLPLVGHARDFQRDPLELAVTMSRGGQELVRMRLYNREVFLANSPALLHELLVEKARHFEKTTALRMMLYPFAGEGLFTANGELWRRQRKIMAPIFQPSQLSRYAEFMTGCALRDIERWREGEAIDVAKEATRITMSVVGKALFDADTFDEADELGAALTVALDWSNRFAASPALYLRLNTYVALGRLAPRLPGGLAAAAERLRERLFYPMMPSASNARLKAALAVLERRIDQMIATRRESGLDRRDLLTTLLMARDEEGRPMGDKQLRDEAVTLFIAGHETTATALAWAFYLLDRHPEARARLEAEADALGRPPTAADLPRLPYALMVFKEAMRLYPPVPVSSRQAIDAVSLGGYELPPLSLVFFSPYSTHRRPDLWPDPERFIPERFTPEAEEARPRYAYLPFGGGPRVCIGNHFAMMEGQLILAAVAQKARLTLVPGHPVVPKAMPTVRPAHGLKMTVHLRA